MEIALSLVELTGLGASIFLFYNLNQRQAKILDLLQFLKKSTVFSPDLLLKVLQKSAPATYLSSLKDLEEGTDYIRGLAFIQGIVDCNHPIISSLNKNSKLIFSSLTHQSIFSNKKGLGMDLYGDTCRSVPDFRLLDSLKWAQFQSVSQKPVKMGLGSLQKLIDILPNLADRQDVVGKTLKRDFFTNLTNYRDLFASQDE